MSSSERFQPHASTAMASMFDDVSGRYDLLNRVMTLGQDGAWREAMWGTVPADAHVVLDLCTGSGVSLPGLRRPGRVVLGVDISFAMLEVARDTHGGPGWAPRVACADAFRLPLRPGSVDAVTVAFGVRNLRPRLAGLAEIARVLRPGGTLSVLEAAAPGPGPLRAPHTMWVRHVIPLAGRLSPDPTAYRYLSDSIFEFGAGPEFEADLAQAGLEVTARRSFMLGATRLWVAQRGPVVGQNRAAAPAVVQDARSAWHAGATLPGAADSSTAEAAGWRMAQAAIAGALTLALAWALRIWASVNAGLPLTSFQRAAGWTLLVIALLVFGVRSAWLLLRISAGAKGR
jgi:demethylmenaquinone methyltransferase/2-methoxy-6-polyprenyl-1,4-benzoquinol methylase